MISAICRKPHSPLRKPAFTISLAAFTMHPTGEEHLIEYLPIGTYTLHEEAAVDGYIVANDVEFTVEET